jgi:hypothetical protein
LDRTKTTAVAALAAFSIVTLGFAPPADSVKLVRAFLAGDDATYSLKVTAKAGDEDIEASGDVQMKVDKVLDGGKAALTCTLRNVKVLFGGTPMEMPVEPFSANWDAMNMPDRLTTQGVEWMYMLIALSSLLPGKDVEIGKDFEVSWENNDRTCSVKGKGKVLEIVDGDGGKFAKVQYDLTVLPENEPEPGTVKTLAEIRVDGGKLIRCEGTVAVVSEGLEMKFSASSAK